MKTKIKVKLLNGQVPLKILDNGEWIDLRLSEDYTFEGPKAGTLKRKKTEDNFRWVDNHVYYLPLGVAMQLPKGFEAIVAPRSSTPKKLNMVCANSIGIIDNAYNADTDEWKFPALPIRSNTLTKGTRICQFRIQLSQKATVWQKLKWLFSNGIKLEFVDSLNNKPRGGFGSTGEI